MKQQQGLALITLIFVMVILATAVATLLLFTLGAASQSNRVLLQARAENAALSLLDASVYRMIVLNHECNDGLASLGANELHGRQVTHDDFSGFVMTIDCQPLQFNQNINIYNLKVAAQYGQPNSAEYIWREFTAAIEP